MRARLPPHAFEAATPCVTCSPVVPSVADTPPVPPPDRPPPCAQARDAELLTAAPTVYLVGQTEAQAAEPLSEALRARIAARLGAYVRCSWQEMINGFPAYVKADGSDHALWWHGGWSLGTVARMGSKTRSLWAKDWALLPQHVAGPWHLYCGSTGRHAGEWVELSPAAFRCQTSAPRPAPAAPASPAAPAASVAPAKPP